MRRATARSAPVSTGRPVSIHAPHAEGDEPSRTTALAVRCFNPRPPCGGRLAVPRRDRIHHVSIHAPHAEGDESRQQAALDAQVSIHAPHAEGDVNDRTVATLKQRFNPRPPCGGRPMSAHFGCLRTCFNPRPPCGGRPVQRGDRRSQSAVSIHAPHAEGDLRRTTSIFEASSFQSTPPMRRATALAGRQVRRVVRFNPRPPCGGRPELLRVLSQVFRFQSTPPMRRATAAGPTVGLTTA